MLGSSRLRSSLVDTSEIDRMLVQHLSDGNLFSVKFVAQCATNFTEKDCHFPDGNLFSVKFVAQCATNFTEKFYGNADVSIILRKKIGADMSTRLFSCRK